MYGLQSTRQQLELPQVGYGLAETGKICGLDRLLLPNRGHGNRQRDPWRVECTSVASQGGVIQSKKFKTGLQMVLKTHDREDMVSEVLMRMCRTRKRQTCGPVCVC